MCDEYWLLCLNETFCKTIHYCIRGDVFVQNCMSTYMSKKQSKMPLNICARIGYVLEPALLRLTWHVIRHGTPTPHRLGGIKALKVWLVNALTS